MKTGGPTQPSNATNGCCRIEAVTFLPPSLSGTRLLVEPSTCFVIGVRTFNVSEAMSIAVSCPQLGLLGVNEAVNLVVSTHMQATTRGQNPVELSCHGGRVAEGPKCVRPLLRRSWWKSTRTRLLDLRLVDSTRRKGKARTGVGGMRTSYSV